MNSAANLPLVSVVTPSLNQGRFIEETILSVKNQDYPRLEHLVIDGGSTDATVDILRRYDHLVWISEPDRGQADAVNRGIRMAKGEILGWLNSDDTYAPGAIRAAVSHLLRHPEVDLVYGDCHVVDERGDLLEIRRSRPFDYRRLLTLDLTIPQPTVFFRKCILEQVGMFDPELNYAMDFHFWVRVGRVGRIGHLPGLVARFRSYAEAKSTAGARDFLGEILFTLDQLFSDPDLRDELARLRPEAYSAAHLAGGIRCYHTGQREEARQLLLKGLRSAPHLWRVRNLKAVIFLFDTLLGTAVGRRLKAFWARSLL